MWKRRTRAFASKRLLVVWGSQTGSATLLARSLVQDAKVAGLPAMCVGAEELRNECPLNPKEDVAVFVQATFGQGEPTDNSRTFFDSLQVGEIVKDLKFAVFGLGQSKTYPDRYQAAGKALDRLLEKSGGFRFMDRGEGDDSGDVEEDFEKWKSVCLNKLKPLFHSAVENQSVGRSDVSPSAREEPVEIVQTVLSSVGANHRQAHIPGKPIDVDNPFPARVAASRRLDLWSEKKTIHLELDLSAAEGFSYETGDYAGVFPANQASVVASYHDVLRLKPETTFVMTRYLGEKKSLFPTPCSVEDYLTFYADIQGPLKRHALQKLLNYSRDEQDKSLIQECLVPSNFKALMQDHKCMLDVLKGLREQPSLAALIDILPPLMARYYSIASSASVSPKTLHLCVGMHHDQRDDGRVLLGVCSTFLGSRKLGSRVPVFAKQSVFKLPESSRVPVVMCAVGTGIAPFRAFLQERSYLPRYGQRAEKDILFYGSMREKQDFLYGEELLDNPHVDVVTAFSHDDPRNQVFVQNRLEEWGELVWANIDKRGAYVYLCGHSKMAAGVHEALKRIARKYGGKSEAEAVSYFAQMHLDHRLQEDVFDSGLGPVEL